MMRDLGIIMARDSNDVELEAESLWSLQPLMQILEFSNWRNWNFEDARSGGEECARTGEGGGLFVTSLPCQFLYELLTKWTEHRKGKSLCPPTDFLASSGNASTDTETVLPSL